MPLDHISDIFDPFEKTRFLRPRPLAPSIQIQQFVQ